MENIYEPSYKHQIHIESKFDSFKANLGIASIIPKTDADIKSLMNYDGTDDEFSMLNDSISLSELSNIEDIKPLPFDPSDILSRKRSVVEVPKKALQLQTISALIDSQGKFNEGHRNRYIVYNKYKHVKLDEVADESSDDLKVNEEVIVAVRLYEPFAYRPNANVDSKPKLSQAFWVLGSQYLSELRDKIYCQCKFGPFYDISDNPDQLMPAENLSTMDSFSLETHFTMTPDNQPLIIRKLFESGLIRGIMLVNLRLIGMAWKKLCSKDLKVRLGYPYLYQHYANCEHLFTISEIRLISATDSLKRKNYPQLKIVSNNKNIFCMICGVAEAHIVVKDSTQHINDPSYLCNSCFKCYHYIDGKKVGSFKAYRYYGNVGCMYEVLKADAVAST